MVHRRGLAVDAEQDLHTVPGTGSNLRRRHTSVKPQRHRSVPKIVRPAGQRRRDLLRCQRERAGLSLRLVDLSSAQPRPPGACRVDPPQRGTTGNVARRGANS